MTPHNKAKKEEIAKVVLMPGDPLRAKWIAENYLTNAKLVNDVRGMYAYTGKYKNQTITVMAHGMGMPSIGIYSYELFKFYDVKAIIRIGSCGGFTNNLKLGDVVVGDEAFSYSIYAEDIGVKVPYNRILKASPELLNICNETAKQLNLKVHNGKILCEDAFYSATPWQKRMDLSEDLIAVEMEAFALYANAIVTNKLALCLLSVSDSFPLNESMTPEQRQTTFKNMVTLAFETALKVL